MSPWADRVLQRYVVRICPECGGQQGEASGWHLGECPNQGKVFAIREIEVAPVAEVEAADKGRTYYSERYAVAQVEVERLRGALREASEELDAAGCQVAASNAHRVANASPASASEPIRRKT